jgi:hypothetical protein
VTSAPPPRVPTVTPINVVMLFNTGPRLRSVSMMAAPSVAVARPVAKPCTARAAINTAAEFAEMNMTMAATLSDNAARIAGRRPI